MPAPIVWISDDSPLEAELLRRALPVEYATHVFLGGAALLERVTSGSGASPDALVLDWQMPDVPGLDVCTFIRKRWNRSTLPILVLTATQNDEELVAAFNAGANDFVFKPCNPTILKVRLGALVERKRIAAQLEREAALRERFIGILGHDLRQPLNTVVMGTRVLQRLPLEEASARTLDRVSAAAGRMHRMISDLLDLTRAREGGGLPIARREVDVGALCASVLDELREGHPGSAFHLTTSGNTVGAVDPDRVTQLCTNLVANAIEHGAPGEAVSVVVAGAEDAIDVSVENLGARIAPASLPGLFGAFRRGQTESGTGLGLGLYIVREIAIGHGGDVRVESDDRSTRFYVTLPRVRATVPAP